MSFRLAFLLLGCAVVFSGCQTLKELAVDVGSVVAGEDPGEPGIDTEAEQIVAGIEAAQPLLPFPIRESLAAIMSGLAVYTVVSKKKEKGGGPSNS